MVSWEEGGGGQEGGGGGQDELISIQMNLLAQDDLILIAVGLWTGKSSPVWLIDWLIDWLIGGAATLSGRFWTLLGQQHSAFEFIDCFWSFCVLSCLVSSQILNRIKWEKKWITAAGPRWWLNARRRMMMERREKHFLVFSLSLFPPLNNTTRLRETERKKNEKEKKKITNENG